MLSFFHILNISCAFDETDLIFEKIDQPPSDRLLDKIESERRHKKRNHFRSLQLANADIYNADMLFSSQSNSSDNFYVNDNYVVTDSKIQSIESSSTDQHLADKISTSKDKKHSEEIVLNNIGNICSKDNSNTSNDTNYITDDNSNDNSNDITDDTAIDYLNNDLIRYNDNNTNFIMSFYYKQLKYIKEKIKRIKTVFNRIIDKIRNKPNKNTNNTIEDKDKIIDKLVEMLSTIENTNTTNKINKKNKKKQKE